MKELTFEEKLTINGGIDENRWGAGYGTAACLGGDAYITYKTRKRKKRKARVKGFAGYIPE